MATHLTKEIPWTSLYARRGLDIKGSPIDQSLSQLQDMSEDIISMAMGCPADDVFPVDTLGALATQIFNEQGADVLNYGPTEGEPDLRRYLLEQAAHQGVRIDPDQVLITTGGMQGLDLVMKLFINPGDVVAVESPTYANAICTIANYEGEFLGINVDDNGMQVEVLEKMLTAGRQRKPKLVYVIPTFQNPTGVTMSLERRKRLVELAAEHHFIILEDDPYWLLRYDGESLPSLLALDEGRGHVVSVNTFAKTLSPGLRVGWTMGPAATIARMVAAKQSMDTCTNQLGQKLVSRYAVGGQLAAYVDTLRDTYRTRRDLLLDALDTHFGQVDGVSWSKPEGGFFVWVTLPEAMDAERLMMLALSHGLVFVPGTAFAATDVEQFRNTLRLNFTYPGPDDFSRGIAALRRAYDDLLAEGPVHVGA